MLIDLKNTVNFCSTTKLHDYAYKNWILDTEVRLSSNFYHNQPNKNSDLKF